MCWKQTRNHENRNSFIHRHRLCLNYTKIGPKFEIKLMISEQLKFFLAKYLTSKSGGDYTEIELWIQPNPALVPRSQLKYLVISIIWSLFFPPTQKYWSNTAVLMMIMIEEGGNAFVWKGFFCVKANTNQQNLKPKRFLDAQASLAPTQVSLSVGPSVTLSDFQSVSVSGRPTWKVEERGP